MSDLITSPVPPDLRALLDNLKAEIFYTLNCHQLGVIESFDPVKQTASIRLSMLRVIGTEEVAYPLLTDCPVMFPAAGGAYMTFPVVKGDPCLVLFNDRDIDNWFTTGNVVAPNSIRAHSLSDGIAILGIRSLANPPNVNARANDAVMVGLGNNFVRITTDGTIQIYRSVGGVGSQIALDGKVGISSTAGGSLKAALDQLCGVLTAWVNTGGSTPNPATLTAITNAKNTIDGLLA